MVYAESVDLLAVSWPLSNVNTRELEPSFIVIVSLSVFAGVPSAAIVVLPVAGFTRGDFFTCPILERLYLRPVLGSTST